MTERAGAIEQHEPHEEVPLDFTFVLDDGGFEKLRDVEGAVEQPIDYTRLARLFVDAVIQDRKFGTLKLSSTSFQNHIITYVHSRVINKRNSMEFRQSLLKEIYTEAKKKDKDGFSLLDQSEIANAPEQLSIYLRGIGSMIEYIEERKKNFDTKNAGRRKRLYVGTNDRLDAMDKIDAVEVVYDAQSRDVDEIRLVQVKSKMEGVDSGRIHGAHQAFVDRLRDALTVEIQERKKLRKRFLYEQHFLNDESGEMDVGKLTEFISENESILTQMVLSLQAHDVSKPVRNEDVQAWTTEVAIDEFEQAAHVTDLALCFRDRESWAFLEYAATLLGADVDTIQSLKKVFETSFLSWARRFTPDLEVLRAVIPPWDGKKEWLRKNQGRMTSVVWQGGKTTEIRLV